LRVRELRLQRGWSLKELASNAGVTEKTLIDLEHERYPARPKTVKKVANALDVSVRELKGMTPQLDQRKATIEHELAGRRIASKGSGN